MAKRGAKPKPTAMLHSGSRVLKSREGEVSPDIVYPDAPSWLNSKAKKIWADIRAELEPQGIVTRQDQNLLAIYASSMADFIEATALEKKLGLIVEDCKGSQKANPATRAKQNAFDRIQRVSMAFGLSPVARVGLVSGLTKDKGKDKGKENKNRYFKIHSGN